MAEGVGFEPTVRLPVRLISSQNARPPAPKTASGSLSLSTDAVLWTGSVFNLGGPTQVASKTSKSGGFFAFLTRQPVKRQDGR